MCSHGGTRDDIIGVADGKSFMYSVLPYSFVQYLLDDLHVFYIDDLSYAGADGFIAFPSGRPK